ncbi:hypothetical protein LINGRAHAP2_LOCUS5959 [Linum grandiflorum]
MCGLITGLDMAWELGCRKVATFIDSQAALDLFLQEGDMYPSYSLGGSSYIPSSCLVIGRLSSSTLSGKLIKLLIILLNIGGGFPLGRHSISMSDPTFGYFLFYDSLGLTEPRRITNNI